MSEVRRLEDDVRRMFHGKPNKEDDMTTPVAGDPGTPEATAAVQQQLAGQAAAVAGTPSAGIYGDQAGASAPVPAQSEAQVAASLQAAGAQPATGDIEHLQSLIAAQSEALAKLQAQVNAVPGVAPAEPPKPTALEDIVSSLSGVAPGVVHALTTIASRLDAAGI